jgi:hypothetical protein
MAQEPPVHVSGDEVHAHPRHVGNRWIDLSLAFAAIFISVVSLFVAIEHGKTERQLVAANSWPFLRAIISNARTDDPEGDVAIGVSNGGVGPAKLQSLQVFYRGEPVSSGVDLLRRCCGLPADKAAATRSLAGRFRYSIVDDTVLRPGEEALTVEVRRAGAEPLVDRFSTEVRYVTFRACYCSVFDECWESDLRSTRVTKVEACGRPQHPFDPNGR